MHLTARNTTILLALVLTALVSGCTMQTKPATNVTTTSATLNARVGCASTPYGPVWWELREGRIHVAARRRRAERDLSHRSGGIGHGGDLRAGQRAAAGRLV